MRKEPARPELVKKILKELRKNPKGLWIRKLARKLNEPTATVHKYIARKDYCGRLVRAKRTDKELGGHLMVKLR